MIPRGGGRTSTSERPTGTFRLSSSAGRNSSSCGRGRWRPSRRRSSLFFPGRAAAGLGAAGALAGGGGAVGHRRRYPDQRAGNEPGRSGPGSRDGSQGRGCFAADRVAVARGWGRRLKPRPGLAPGDRGQLLSGMMVAMVGVLWAYDGWVNLTPLAEEVRDPGRKSPGDDPRHGRSDRRLPCDDAVVPLRLADGRRRLGHADKWTDRAVAALLLRPPSRAEGGLRDLHAGHVLDVHLAQRQRARPARGRTSPWLATASFRAASAGFHPRYNTPANAIAAQGLGRGVDAFRHRDDPLGCPLGRRRPARRPCCRPGAS